MIVGVVDASRLRTARRMDATFFLCPTKYIDRDIKLARSRIDRDRARLRVLVKQRREVLAKFKHVTIVDTY